jgi:hypothetical protein
VLFFSLLNISNSNLAGRAYYTPIQVYGKISPGLPDGTRISFRVMNTEIASALLKNNTYGEDSKMYFSMDDISTTAKEGYMPGDIVRVYIEDVEVAEYSYFEGISNRKDINLPVDKRTEISTKAALLAMQRSCTPEWQCSEWSKCAEGVQTRVCNDINNCGILENKPDESTSCTMPPSIEQPITEERTKDKTLGIIITAILAIGIIGLIVSLTKRARKIKARKKGKKR